jgi:hypothetical protein
VDRLTEHTSIPRTTIQRWYKRVCNMSYKQRRALADELIADPSPLVAEFLDAVATFAPYNNVAEGFYSNKNRAPKKPDTLGVIFRTHHVAWYLRQQRTLEVRDAPELTAKYLDYEIAPARTTGHAKFDDGGTWRGGVFIDLLLASCAPPRTPIVAELKIRADKDPFTALIQSLACAAHLATQHQYNRLRQHVPAAGFLATDRPRLDVYVLLYRFLETQQDDLEALDTNANALSGLLVHRPEVAAHVRRIACIAVELGSDGKLSGACRWQHGG